MTETISAEEYAALAKKRHKYGAKATEVDGIRFASKAEAERYGELVLLLRAGEIINLRLQPRFPLIVNGIRIGTYVADFQYTDPTTLLSTVEDVKGMATPVYRIKKKLVEAIYGITIVEVPT